MTRKDKASAEFLRDFDRFGQPVGLTYKNNPSYNTPIGGVFTMLAFFIFMSWLALETIDVYMPPGKHNVSSSDVQTQALNSSWPLQDMTESNFFVSYKMRALGTNNTMAGTEDQYFSGLWVQRENGIPIRYYKPVQCSTLYDQEMVSQMFWQNVNGYWCPDMRGQNSLVQNYSPQNFEEKSYDFFFVLDTCEHLAQMTGRTDCKTEAESQAVLEQMYVDTKIQTEFWNTPNFLRSGWQMNSQFESNTIQLNSAVFQRQAYSLITNNITFRNNRWINLPFMPKWDPGMKYKAYDVSSAFNTIYPVSDKTALPTGVDDVNPQDTYFSMQFTENSKTKSISSTREAVNNTFQRFGSYLALVLRFVGYILGAYQRFSLDNSMTKKLYNHLGSDDNENRDKRMQQHHEVDVPEDGKVFQQNLTYETKRREPFKYTMWRFMFKKNFSSPWCCCCRHRNEREDNLQAKAKTRLYQELDIMGIIQKLRVARFVSELELSEEQRYLVNYHNEYMLFNDGHEDFNAARYTDNRKEVQGQKPSRHEHAQNVVESCINELDASNPKHQETYRRIMGRGRKHEEAVANAGDDDENNAAGGSPNAAFRNPNVGGADQSELLAGQR